MILCVLFVLQNIHLMMTIPDGESGQEMVQNGKLRRALHYVYLREAPEWIELFLLHLEIFQVCVA